MKDKINISTIKSVSAQSQKLVSRANQIITKDDVKAARRLRIELAQFIKAVNSRWMGKRLNSLRIENRMKLRDEYELLLDADLRIINFLFLSIRGNELYVSLSNVDAPMITSELAIEEVVDKKNRKFFFSKEFLADLEQTDPPMLR